MLFVFFVLVIYLLDMRPKSLSSSICSFSTSSKVVSPLFILLKVCNGPLNLEKLIDGILKSLKL